MIDTDGQTLRRLKWIAIVVFENLVNTLTVFQSLLFTALYVMLSKHICLARSCDDFVIKKYSKTWINSIQFNSILFTLS